MVDKIEATALLEKSRLLANQEKGEDALKAAMEASELFKEIGDLVGTGEALCAIIVATIHKEGPKEALRMAKEELEKSSGNKLSRAFVLQGLAAVQLEQGLPNDAVGSLKEAETIYDELGNRSGVMMTSTMEATAYIAADKPKAGLSAAISAVDIATEIQDEKGEAKAWLATMKARLAIDKYDDALKAAEAALVAFMSLEDEAGKAETLCNITQAHVKNKKYDKATKAGGVALDVCRKLGATKWEHIALDSIVEALIGMDAKDEALRQAKAGVSYLERRGEKRAMACAMQSRVHAHVAMGGQKEGLGVAQDALAVFKDLGDTKLQAGMLTEIAKLHAVLGEMDDAKAVAEEANSIYVEFGDIMGQANAMDVLGSVVEAEAVLSQEEERKELVQEKVKKLSDALGARDGPEFKDALDSLYNDENATVDDVEGVFESFMKVDPDGVAQFVQDNQPDSAEPDESDDRKWDNARPLDRRWLYFMFRMGAMGYGPGFRLMKTAYRQGHNLQKDAFGHSTLMLRDDHDDWEEYTLHHAGIYDCILQTGGARGMDQNIQYQLTRPGPANSRYNPSKRYTLS